METDSPLTDLAKAVLGGAAELGVSDPSIIETRVLTRDGYFVGRHFICNGISALWLADDGVIRFRDDSGTLLKTIIIGQDLPEKRAA